MPVPPRFFQGLPLAIFLGVSLWFVILGWLVSPWLEMYGLVVLLVLVLATRERKRP